MFTRLSHDPDECADALRLAAPGAVVSIDCETTGLGRRDRLVSVGVLVDKELFVLFVGAVELTVAILNITQAALRWALAPLAVRSDLIVIMHNAGFDLGFLKRAGVEMNSPVFDTAKLFLLLDGDRKRKDSSRYNRRHNRFLNYRLKDLVEVELGLAAPHFPGRAELLTYDQHVPYLASDVYITRRLFDYLIARLSPTEIEYYRQFVAPVTPLLVAMTVEGVNIDAEFIEEECRRLLDLMKHVSSEHHQRFGARLDGGDYAIRGHLFFNRAGLRCYVPKSKWVQVGGRRLPPLQSCILTTLRSESNSGSRRHDSLGLVIDYLTLRGLMVRLATLRDKHVDRRTSKIYTILDDWQTSGRVSATKPNLQGVANNVVKGGKRELVSEIVGDVVIRSRNAICSSEGTWLAAFDIDQADSRAWADRSRRLDESGAQLIERLQEERRIRLEPQIGPYLKQMWRCFRPQNRKPIRCSICNAAHVARRKSTKQILRCETCEQLFVVDGRVPDFDPKAPSSLVEDFTHGGGDFYTTAATRSLGHPPRNKAERNFMKQTILGLVNGMSARGLATRLDVDLETAGNCIRQFAQAYPKEMAYIDLMHHAAAITGYAESLGGRRRRVTPHFLMVNEPEVELFVSYRGADKLWIRVVPLEPGRHTLTCWVKSVIDAKYDSPRRGQEIYHHQDGRISQAPYRFFDDSGLVFQLPVRNISWRIIRRVRTASEECRYEGFDKTRRQLTNHIFQASTADIARLMMLRSQPLCREFGARLVLQIHDELLFSVPGTQRRLMQFVRAASKVLEQPPTPDFSVPITVGPKIGTKFGELRDLERWEYMSPWPVRWWRHSAQAVRLWLKNWREKSS